MVKNYNLSSLRYLNNRINGLLTSHPSMEHLELVASGINHIDSSVLQSLLELNTRLDDKGIKMHFSDVKGPMLDRLQRINFADELTGTVYLSQHQAWQDLTQLY